MKKLYIVLLILLTAIIFTVADILLSCNSEKRSSKDTPIVMKYSPQDVVYMRPDSSVVLIDSIEIDYNYYSKGNNTGFYIVSYYDYYGNKITKRITEYSIFGKIENP